MSTKSDSGSEDIYDGKSSSTQYGDDVCRDYLRNSCSRGRRCRYRHPTQEDSQDPPPRREITFCHDFQNNGCSRNNCKFLHCSRDEEEWFKRTGLLPARLNNPSSNFSNGGSNNNNNNNSRSDLPPICKDYLHGECKRGSKCRFRHSINNNENGHEFNSVVRFGYDRFDNGPLCKDFIVNQCNRGNQCRYWHISERDFERISRDGMALKRRRMDDNDYDRFDRNELSFSYLEEENETLKKKVEDLKKQVSDLTAINEVLLEQNARYRVSKGAAMVPVSQPTLTAVAMAPTPLPATGITAGPVHAQANLTHLNSSLTSPHTIQTAQRIAAATGGLSLTGQQATQMAAPSLTPTVTISQNIAGPMALTQSNLIVSMAQMAAPPQLQVAHSLTQNLGAPSTSLVSYPIMSQNMRSAVEHNSLAH